MKIDVPNNALFSEDSNSIKLDDFVKYVLNLSDIQRAIYPRITSLAERQFWFSYSKPGGLGTAEWDGNRIDIVDLWVGLDVEHTMTPVQFASGVYRGTPFVEGASLHATNQLQFVLLKKADGSCEGAVVDAAGIRKLLSSPLTS